MDSIDSFGGWLWSFAPTNTSNWQPWNDTDPSILPFVGVVRGLSHIVHFPRQPRENDINSVGF